MRLPLNGHPQPIGGWLAAAALCLGLAACGGGGGSSTAASSGPVAQPTNTAGRLLASNCFQCHGTGGLGGFEQIRGSDAGEVQEFVSKSASSSIMAAHAQGYTPEQLRLIIAYLKQ